MIHIALLYFVLQMTQPASEHEEAGMAALRTGNHDVAIAELTKATELSPRDSQAYLYLGMAYIQKRDYAAAIVRFKQSLAIDPNLAEAHKPLAYALLSQGYFTEAVVQFQATDDKAGLGIAQLESGDLWGAVKNLEIAAQTRPDDPDLSYYLARATGLMSKQLYDHLMSAFPASPQANEAAGDNYAALLRSQQAEEYYKAALHERPDLPGIHLALGLIYVRGGNWNDAEEAFRTAAKLQPGNAEAAYRLGDAYLHNGEPHQARLELERADKLQPDMAETLYALGKACSLEGEVRLAENDWKRVIAQEKTGKLAAEAHFALAGLYRKQGRKDEAAHEMQEFQRANTQTDAPASPQ